MMVIGTLSWLFLAVWSSLWARTEFLLLWALGPVCSLEPGRNPGGGADAGADSVVTPPAV